MYIYYHLAADTKYGYHEIENNDYKNSYQVVKINKITEYCLLANLADFKSSRRKNNES